MHIDYDNYEYKCVTQDILSNREFKKIDSYKHHGITRLEHCRRVSFYSYKLCKRLGLDYVSAARGGLLHDFFMNGYREKGRTELLLNHPNIALCNSEKHFELNEVEKDIIKSHMFPVNINVIPKYKESYIVTLVDKIACIYERYIKCKFKVQFGIGKFIVYLFVFMTC